MPADRPEPAEPLAPWWCEVRTPGSPLRRIRFELSSRGDRVPGVLHLPAHPGPRPLVLLGHEAGGSKRSAELDALAAPWLRGGAAVASIDWPLHGERASGKLSGLLLAGPDPARASARDMLTALWQEVARQATSDLARTLDWLAALDALDSARVGYVGFGLGALLGARFCARDDRPCVVVLGDVGAGIGPPGLDPLPAVGRIASPLLLVQRDAGGCPRAAAQALYEAAAEPRERLRVEEGPGAALPGAAVTALWRFLAARLDLQADGAGRAAFPPPPGQASPGS